MALARYRDSYWFPNGILAANVEARVFPLSSSVFAQLWTDVTGTTPLPNPLSTNGAGVLEFWAEEGEYWIHIDTETFRIQVGSPVVDLFEVASATLSTGVLWGGSMVVNAGNPLAVDVDALVGYVVDVLTDPVRPTIRRVSAPAQTVVLDAAAQARTLTWFVMDANGVLTQQAARPGNVQSRTHIVLGIVAQAAGAIYEIEAQPVILAQPGNQYFDLVESLRPFNILGNIVSPNGANLMLNVSAGTAYARAFNHFLNGVLTNNPHVVNSVGQSPAQWRYSLRNTTVFPPLTNLVDRTNYDLNGVLTPVGGGANTSTVQRVWHFPTTIPANEFAIQYGQNTYSSLSNAINAIGSGTFVPHPELSAAGVLVAYIAVTRTATNLSDPTQAMIITPGKFALP